MKKITDSLFQNEIVLSLELPPSVHLDQPILSLTHGLCLSSGLRNRLTGIFFPMPPASR